MEPSSDFPFLVDLLVGKTTSKPLKKEMEVYLSLSIRYLSIKIYDESIIYIVIVTILNTITNIQILY